MMPFSCFTESTPTEESEEMILRESLDQEKLKYVLTMSDLCVAQQYIFSAKKVHSLFRLSIYRSFTPTKRCCLDVCFLYLMFALF